MTPAVINVVSATRTGDRALRLNFDDGKVQEEDIKPFFQHAVHPDIWAYLVDNHFDTFRIEHVNWCSATLICASPLLSSTPTK